MRLFLHVYREGRPARLVRTKDAWTEQQHPRGQPKNKGEFAKGSGGSPKAKVSTTKPAATAQSVTKSPKVDAALKAYDLSKKTDADQAKAYRDIAQTVFQSMGIDKSVNFSVSPPKKFTVGNRKCTTAGWYTSATNTVNICTGVDPHKIDNKIAHEAMHAKFEAIRKAYNKETEAIIDGVAGSYPLHKSMGNSFGPPLNALARDDGVTPYSTAYWKQAATDHKPQTAALATNETLAEMASLDQQGKLKGLPWYKNSTTYKPFYESIHKLYPAAVAALR